ncbi:MAG TPA: hypothetical protein VN327_01825 [Pseudonocardiaceae bacterium]|jgi:hypothetical protein|nr:hypothetical protein [Pseudonocardiaceae bacterium]
MIVGVGRAVRRRRSEGGRALRELSGVLAGGLVALAIAVCVAQWLASTSGRPGPGMAAVVGHVVAALAAVVLQLAAERALGRTAALASWSVLVLTAGVLWFGWWA